MNADEFRLRAEAGEIPSVDPKLQTAARSGNRYAQREMERQMAAQQAEAERQAAIQARQAEMQAKQAARQTERDAVELQARNVRIGAAAGQKVVTDIETGKRSIATHPDGAPVYKTGPVGAPQITSVQPAGPMPDGGNITPVTEVKQTYRNDRGDTITSPVEQKTDPKTGQTYVERKDAYGRPQRVTTGVDPLAQQKLLLEQESAKLDIHGNNLRAQRMQIEPRIKAVEDEWKAAETDWNKPPKFIQQNGKWVDPATGMPADEQQRADWQRSQVGIEARYRSAKRRYEQESPALKNLEEQERQLTMRKLDLDTKRTALEHGLPAEDGGTAETLTRQQTGQTNPEHDQVMRDIASVPGMGAVIDLANNDQNWKQPTTPDIPAEPIEKPLIPTDDEGKRALFINAFPGLRHAEQYTVGKSEQGWTWIQRNGENIGTIERDPKDGSPAFVLNQNLVQQGGLRDTIAMGTTTGIPIYLADTGKPKDQAAESQYVASIFTALRDDPAMQDQTVSAARLKDMGADPASIMRKVQAGEMSVQRGESLMKNLYGGTLQASNPEDPATMQRWLQETKTRADKELQDKYGDPRLHDPNAAGRQWEAASTGLGTSATTKNQIRQDFLRDNYLENRGKPGVSRAKYLALHQQDLADSMTLGENVLSKLHAIGKSTRDDVLGSMIGLAGGAALSLGQAEFAILGDKRAAAQFSEDMRLRNRDFASWTNSAKRNLAAWTTPQGIKTAGEFDNAMTSLQRAIDADEESSTPETQAAVSAAEQRARQSALAMHNLAPDESWPTTSDDLDPAKDTALASALNGYRATADPRFFSLYRDRMLMGNGRRQYSSELERKIGPSTGGFFSSMDHAMYAGWQEAASEVAADTIAIASGVASKAIQAGLKGIGMTARATRLGKFSASIAKGLSAIDELALAKGTLQRPLTGMQKARNIAVQGIKGAAGEGMEEVSTEIGAESPQLLQAFGSGMLGVVGLSPAMIVSHFVASTDMPQREMDRRNAKWANTYNATMQGTVGFQPITAEHANTARSFINPKTHQALVEGLTAQLQQIEAPQPLSPEQTSYLQQERQQLSSMIETHLDENNASLTPEALAGIEKRAAEIDAQLHPTTDAGTASRQQQRAAIEQTLQQIAAQTEDAITAARQVAEIKDPAERAFYSGLAKVATGNHALLTTAERKAVQGRQTAAGADYFAPVTMPDGQTIETVTPEARAETMMNMPAVGRLIQTTESDTLVAQQLGVTPESAPADTPVQEGPNAIRLPATPEQKQQAAAVVQAVMQRLQAEYPQLAARTERVAPNPDRVTGGVVAVPYTDGTSSIGIIHEDIENLLAHGETPETLIEKTVDNIVLHETLHTLQFQIVDGQAESFYGDLYTQMTPQMLANGRELYGAANWDVLKEWQRAAEVVRMLAEAKIAGRTTDVHRLTAGADASLLARIAEVIKAMVEAITTGTVPESVKQHVDALTELYQELIHAPENQNASPADPGNSQQQPAPSQESAGNSQPAEGNRDSTTPIDGGTEPAPSPDTGAPGFQPPSEELTAARKITTEAFRRALETKPILKKDADLLREVSDVAYQLAEQIAGMPEAERKRSVENAINSFLLSPEIADRVSELYAEEKAKTQAYRAAALARIRAEARRIIAQKMNAINHLIGSVGRINRPPNALVMIAAGETLPAEYEAALRVSHYPGGGKNAVVREIINMIWAPDETSGISPDKAAKGMEMPSGKYANLTGDELWQLFQKEISGYINGAETAGDIYDPDAELSDDQMAAALEKLQADQTVDKWRELTGRQNLMRGEALRLEEAYQRIVRDELGGVEPDDFTADDIYGRVIEEAKRAQKPAAQPQSAPQPNQQTPAQKAPLNSRVAELSRPMDGLIIAGAVLDSNPLQAAQNHLPNLTRVRKSPLVERAIALAERIIPFFQGNKLKMTAPVASAAEQYWTKDQREAITTIYDLFGGGGAWGLTLAESLFPNVRQIHINEFDETRAIKIRAQIEYGDKFAEIATTPEVRHAIASIIAAHRLRPAVQRKIERARSESMQQNFIGEQQLTPDEIAEENEAWSWGVINKTAAQYAKSLDSTKQDRVVAILKTMADDPERSGPWFKADPESEPTVDEIVQWFQSRHAPKAAAIKATADRINQRAGINVFQFTRGDAYSMDIENGPGVMVIADPPYFATTGYDEVNQKQVVGTDYYQRSYKLMEDLVANDNHVIYTDEAWWLRDKIDNAIRPADLVTGQKLAAQIANTLDFTVVAEQIDSRYETLGLHNPLGSPVAASRSASGSRDLRGNNQGTGDGGGNQRGGGTAAVEVSAGTDGEAGIQPSGNGTTETGSALTDRLASAPMDATRQPGEAGEAYYDRVKRMPAVTFPESRIVYHQTGSKSADAITRGEFKSGKDVGIAEKRGGVYFADRDVNEGVYARTGELEAHEGQTPTWLPIDIKGLKLLNTGYTAPDGTWPLHKLHGAEKIRGEFHNLPEGFDGFIDFLSDGRIYEVALPPDKANQARSNNRLFSAPIDPKNPFGEWSAPVSHPGVLIGYRGSKAPSGQDNNFGGSEGIGLYLAKLERDAEFFGDVREVKFPEPKRPLVVDEDSGTDIIPMLNEDAEDVWNHIFGHKVNATDSEWIKAHVWAAKRIGLTEDTWSEKIDQFPRALTDMLLKMGYDAVYVRSGGMEWVNLLAKEGQRFNRGARSETGAALYSAPSTNPAAQYRYLKAKQEKAGLTSSEQEALLRAERDMGQSFAFDMDRRALAAPRGSVTPRFQPFLRLEQESSAPPAEQLALFSPAPTPDQQAADAALRNLPPLYREVFQASIADPKLTPQDLGRRFGIPARGAENIINQVRTRLRANTEAANDGLAPKGNSGRPDLGYSTVPSLQRVDQIRAQEGLPLQQTTEEIRGQAEALLRQPDSVRQLIDATEDWTSTQTAAANIELVNRALQGRNDLETAELAAAYREQGSRWSETGRARRDVHRSPSERNAMLIADLLTVPDASTSSGLKKAKTKAERDAILQGWVARVKGIKEHMLARGVDLDEALQRLNQQMADAKASESEASAAHQQLVSALQQQLEDARINLKQAEQAAQDATDSAMKAKADAEAARAAQRVTEAENATKQAQELDPANTIKLELRKLSMQHRAVVEAMRDGATWEQAAAATGLTVQESRRVMQGFINALRQAAIKTLMLAEDMLLGNALASPALNAAAPEDRQQRLGRMADAMIAAMGYDMARFDRVSNPTPAKTGKTKRQSTTKQDRPEPAMMSDEEFIRRQNNPDTHRALWQFESSLTRPSSRVSFDEWINRPETKARIERQTRMWQESVSTTTGTLDMHDPKSTAAVARELHATRASLFDKVLEFWRQSILSGPQTAIVNTGSNIANTLYNLAPRRIVEAGVNDVLGIIGQGNKDAATFGELSVMARHIHHALARAGRNMVSAWNNESRIAEYQFLAIPQQIDFAGLKEDYVPPAIGGKFGKLMRSISFRHMTAADEFIKAFHGHLEAAAQAHRIAKQEKLTGSAYESRITELMQEGSEAWSRALAIAEDVTFQRKLNTKDPRALAVLDKIASATKRGAGRYKAMSFFFPFVNTPTNIFKSAIEMSPVGGLLAVIDGARALKIKIARGNMTKEQAAIAASELYDSARFVKDVTNQLISAGIYWAVAGMVEPDDDDDTGLPRITGTTDWKSTRKGVRDNQYRTMPPQSIRLGDGTIVSYARIEPFSTVLAGVVDLIRNIHTAGGLNEKALSAYMGSIQNQLDDKTFLSGLSDLINAYHDPERFAAKLAGNITTGFVPNLIRQPIREADPYVRNTKPREEDGFFTAIAKQVGYTLAPGYAPPMMDVWGNPVTKHQGVQIGGPQTDVLIRVFDPTNLSIGKQIDPIDRYIFNWNRSVDAKDQLAIEPISNTLQATINGKQVKLPLTPEEHAAANHTAGKTARAFLGNQWDRQPDQQGIDRIKEIVHRFQSIERDKLRARKLREMK